MKKFLIILLVLSLAFGLVACGDSDKEKKKPAKQKKKVEKVESATYQSPLSGELSSKEWTERPVAVVVSNATEARPQTGLTQADIVFEFLAEGPITRFLAIYQSHLPAKVGPARSAREYFLHTAKGYNAFFVAHGFSAPAKKLLNENYIDNINGMYYDGSLFHRDKTRYAPHNSYITGADILKGEEKVGADKTMKAPSYLFYSADELKNLNIEGTIANEIHVSYFNGKNYSPTFKYDSTSGKYSRWVKNVKAVDRNSKAPVLIDNLMVLEMKHTHHPKISSLREIDTESGGSGFLFQKGQKIPIQWKNIDGKITPFVDGNEAKLIPGHTWISVVQTSPGLDKLVTTK